MRRGHDFVVLLSSFHPKLPGRLAPPRLRPATHEHASAPAMMDAPWSYAPPYDIDHAQFLRDGFVILREA